MKVVKGFFNLIVNWYFFVGFIDLIVLVNKEEGGLLFLIKCFKEKVIVLVLKGVLLWNVIF